MDKAQTLNTQNQDQRSIYMAINANLRVREVIAEHSEGSMNHREYQILEYLTDAHLDQKQVVMEQGMSLKHLGSRYTLRKSIQRLIDNGYIKIPISQDSRVRRLVPTDKAMQLFTSIGDTITAIMVTITKH
jgi:DNA-binding MarR family transcriptional regulator